jgi:hypothetical protein
MGATSSAAFEEALTELQNEVATSGRFGAPERLQKLETAVVDVFRDMNRSMAQAKFSFLDETGWTIPEFLTLFDAIFTLNQDLLLEKHYLIPPPVGLSLVSRGRWDLGVIPGMDELPNPAVAAGRLYDPLLAERRPVASPRGTVIAPRQQPYFKLHGSINWQANNGGRLLMGGNKPTTMQSHRILMWYADKFAETLSRPNARLMVIGYGFGDGHINQLIHEAWEKGGKTLSIFIVHPDGREMLRKVNPTYGKPIYCPGPLEEIVGAYDSTRPLRTTFDGSDPGEHDLLMQYAEGK